jgi:hypothetical protein
VHALKQPRGCGARHALATAIVVALAGAAIAAEPSLRVLSPITGGATENVVELSSVEFRPGSRVLVARSVAGNVECGPEQTVGNVLKLELDGKFYAIRTGTLPTGLSAPISYAPTATQFSLSLEDVQSNQCASTGVTMFDFVKIGPDGQVTARSRVSQLIQVLLPEALGGYPLAVIRVADPLHCESYGANDPGVAGQLTYPNQNAVALFGLDRLEYRLQTVGGRREIRHHPKVSPFGVQLVQCSSPGLLMGAIGAGGGSPDVLFASSFELREAQADVVLDLASNARLSNGGGPAAVDTIGFEGDDGVYMTLTVRNIGRSAARDVRVREYLRNGSVDEMQVVAGELLPTCTPLPENAEPNPCTGLDLDFPLSFEVSRLDAGQGLAVQLHRKLLNEVVGEEIKVGYAAFVDPLPSSDAAADATLGNNAQWVNFAVS